MAANFAWGIDVGNRALKAVKLVREGDQLKVDDFDVIEHETVLSNAGDNKDELIKTALASFVERHPGKGGQYAIGVSGQASFAHFIKLPPVEPKKIPEIVRFEAIQQIPFPLDDVEWSYQLFQSEESPDVEVGIFAMRRELVNQQIQFYTDFDLNVQVVQMNPLAVYNAMYHDNRLSGTTMVIDLGAENTDLIICDNETIWLRSIPIGGNSFSDALVKAFKLNFTKAEEMKRNAATNKYARQIFQAMRPIFADLVAEIQRSVGFYASVHRDSRIKKVLALGGTFKLPGLQKYLQQNLQLDVERLDTIAAAPSSDSKLAPTFNENILSIVSAYGLAMQAMGASKITSSLLPAKIRREKMWKEKTPLFGAAAALFAAGLGVGMGTWWYHNMAFSSLAAQNANGNITDVLNRAQDMNTKWAEIQGATEPARQRIVNIQTLLNYRSFWPKLVESIQESLPQTKKPQFGTLDVEKIKSIKRADRQIVLIDSIVSDYYPDITTMLTADIGLYASTPNGVSAMTTTPPVQLGPDGTPILPDPSAPAPPRGYIVTIRCTTPHASGGGLIQKEFIPELEKIKPSASDRNKPFHVVKAQLVTQQLVNEDELRKTKLRDDYQKARDALNQVNMTSGTWAGGEESAPARPFAPNMITPAPMNATGIVEDTEPFKDRATGESVLNDWEITLVLLVQIDPPPWTPAPPAGQQAAAQ